MKLLATRIAFAGLAGAFLISVAAGIAMAAGTDSNTQTCQEGWVWDEDQNKCVQRHSEVLPDQNLANYAYALAKEGRYQEALDTLAMMKDPNTAEALNYKGYATRKLGRIEEGIGYYLQSVKLDSNYTQVREYLGEAYIQLGRLDLAHEQLGAIGRICGSDCENYQQLKQAIDAAL